jgi:hypothetical protein
MASIMAMSFAMQTWIASLQAKYSGMKLLRKDEGTRVYDIGDAHLTIFTTQGVGLIEAKSGTSDYEFICIND